MEQKIHFVQDRSLFYADWYERDIWSATDVMDDDGNPLNYSQFCTKHSFNPLKSDFIKLHKALPQQFVFLAKNIMAHQTVEPQHPTLPLQG
ncbi:MAG: hypothetical protein ATN33_00305 [Epulopiscium sp. Nele67-Bin001]|nr:MAG: hypothetical protein ATN33_00305 [Epulopiscium sp. Nele67-Bin001]